MIIQAVRCYLSGGAEIFSKTAEATTLVTETTSTSTAWRNPATLTILASEQVANAYYVVFWSVDAGTSLAASPAYAIINKDNSANVAGMFQTFAHYGNVADDTPFNMKTLGSFVVVQAAATPVDIEIDLLVRQGTATSQTFKYRNARLTAMLLGPDDFYSENLPNTVLSNTTTNKTQTNIGTLNIAAAGDYVVLAWALAQQANTTNTSLGFELTDGTNTTGEKTVLCTGRGPMCFMLDLPGVTPTRTVNLKFRQAGSGSASIEHADVRMLAIRLNRFSEAHKATLGAASSGTDTASTTAHSQTFTAENDNYLTLAGWIGSNNNLTYGSQATFIDSGTTVNDNTTHFLVADVARGECGFSHRRATFAAGSRTQSIDRASENAAATTRIASGAYILTLRLKTP